MVNHADSPAADVEIEVGASTAAVWPLLRSVEAFEALAEGSAQGGER